MNKNAISIYLLTNLLLFLLFLYVNPLADLIGFDIFLDSYIYTNYFLSLVLFIISASIYRFIDLNKKVNVLFINLILLLSWNILLSFLSNNSVLLIISLLIDPIILINFFLFFGFFSSTNHTPEFKFSTYFTCIILGAGSVFFFMTQLYMTFLLIFTCIIFSVCLYLAIKYRLRQRGRQIKKQQTVLLGLLTTYLPVHSFFFFSTNAVVIALSSTFFLALPVMIGYTLLKRNKPMLPDSPNALIKKWMYHSILSALTLLGLFFFFDFTVRQCLLVALSVFIAYFISREIKDFSIYYQLKSKGKNNSELETERLKLVEQLELDQHLQALGKQLVKLVNQLIPNNGLTLLWLEGNTFTVLTQTGQLQSAKLSKEAIHSLKSSTTVRLIEEKNCLSVPLIYNGYTVGLLLLTSSSDIHQLKQKYSTTTELLKYTLGELLATVDLLRQKRGSIHLHSTPSLQEKKLGLMYLKRSEQFRKEVSYFLHDDLLQNILAVQKMAEFSLETAANEKETLQFIDQQLTTVNLTVREKMFDFYPSFLADLSFKESLRILIETLEKQFASGQKIKMTIMPEDIDVPEEIKFTLYRMLRELLQNAYKYSNATNLMIQFSYKNDFLVVSVEDDGVGFDPAKLKNQDFTSKHFGLLSISNELHSLSGMLNIAKATPRGTSITLYIPNTDKE